MRTLLTRALVVALAVPAAASAQPRLEASGFLGVGLMPRNTQLGDAMEPEQVPGSAALFGMRLAVLLSPPLVLGDDRLQVALEAEGAVGHSYTRTGTGERARYHTPVFGARAHLLFRYERRHAPLFPHLLLGAGTMTVLSSSPHMRDDTDPVLHWGGGFTFPLTQRWHARIDGRHLVMPARGTGLTGAVEIQFAFGVTFGGPARRTSSRISSPPTPRPAGVPAPPAVVTSAPPDPPALVVPAPPVRTSSLITDLSPTPVPPAPVPMTPPPAPPPTTPTPTTTQTGVAPELAAILETASRDVSFDARRSRVNDSAQKALVPVLEMLAQHRELRLVITSRTGATASREIARRRADAVKWFLVDEGLAEGRFVTRVVADDTGGPPLELTVIVE